MGNEFRTVILVPFSGMQLDVKLHISMYLLVCTILLLSTSRLQLKPMQRTGDTWVLVAA